MPMRANSHTKWSVLSGLFLVYMASNGITLHTLPMLYPELMEEFGWRESEVTLPATVFFVVGAITSPPAGWLLDRYSSRVIIALGSLLLSLGLMGYSTTHTLWQLVAIYAVLGIALSLCGLVSNMVMLTSWFSAGRGRATGILLMASSLGGAIFPLMIGIGMEVLGWRHTILLAGIGVAVTMLMSSWLLLRDGRSLRAGRVSTSPTEALQQNTPSNGLFSVMRERRFLAIIFVTGSLWFIIIALTQHQSIFLARDVGLERGLLPSVFSLFFASSVLGKLAFGLLSDRFDLHKVMSGATLMLAASLVILSRVTAIDQQLVFFYAVLAGLGFSGAFTCIQILVAAHYAGTHYGRILAVVVLIDTLFGALGTRTIALIREWQGEYVSGLLGMSALAATSALVVMRLSRPHKKQLSHLER
ncbi:MAG: MFS transporter [Luminiphilus sp.]|nr:MFS transporter [Luminiphilus sp.]